MVTGVCTACPQSSLRKKAGTEQVAGEQERQERLLVRNGALSGWSSVLRVSVLTCHEEQEAEPRAPGRPGAASACRPPSAARPGTLVVVVTVPFLCLKFLRLSKV